MQCCLVTICIGEKYLKEYNKIFKPSQENYAKKCNYDFKILTDYIKEPKHPHLIYLNKILVCDYQWDKEYDYIIYVDADIVINENTPPIHIEYNFGDKIGVVNQSQPTLQARIELQKHSDFELSAKDYYKLCSNHIIDTLHVINTGVLVIQPKKHKLFLRNIFDTYYQKNINNFPKIGPHYEQSIIGYEIQKNNMHFFMNMKWNALWANNKDFYNTMKKQLLTLQGFYDNNYFIHFCGHADFHLIPNINSWFFRFTNFLLTRNGLQRIKILRKLSALTMRIIYKLIFIYRYLST